MPKSIENINISVCIPTRNRKDLLEKCIKSILNQSVPPFEIVIIDGNSSDDTKEMILNLSKKFNFIKYFFQETHNGIALDVINSLNCAKGDYCWMMSDDDLLHKDAINDVSHFLNDRKNISGLSVGYTFFDKTMSYKIKSMRPTRTKIKERFIEFNSIEDTFEEIGHHLGFLSGQIINRKKVINVITAQDMKNFLNPWIIINLVGLVLKKDPYWAFLNIPLVHYRSGNDSFLNNGVYKRQLITHKELRNTFLYFFNKKSKTFKLLMSSLVSIRMPRALAVIKANNASYSEIFLLLKLYIKYYWVFPSFWIKVFPIFLIPNFVINIFRFIYNSFKKVIH